MPTLQKNINIPANYISNINKLALEKYKNIASNAKRQIVPLLDKMFSLQYGHEKELTEIGKQIILDNYGDILEGVQLDIKIVNPFDKEKKEMAEKTQSEEESEGSEDDEFKKEKDLTKEIDKRKLLNNIIQGESQNIIELIYFEKDKVNKINTELLDTYKKVFALNKSIEWTEDVDLSQAMQEAPEFANMMSVNWDEETNEPIVKVRALDLPMLIHETVKGIYELIIMKDPNFDQSDIQEIIAQTDTLQGEQEDIKYGPYIAKDIRTYIQNVINKHPKASKVKNIIEFIYSKIAAMDVDDFNYLITGILKKEIQYESIIKEFIDEILEEFEQYDISQVQNTFDTQEDKYEKATTTAATSSELSNDEIYKMIDDALDKNDYKKAEELSKLLKESYLVNFKKKV